MGTPSWACLACREREATEGAGWLTAPCAEHRVSSVSDETADHVVAARAVTEYGITFVDGAREGETIGPLTADRIAYYNRHWWGVARLVVRTRWVYDEAEEWARATDDQVDHWNHKVLGPHVRRQMSTPPGDLA